MGTGFGLNYDLEVNCIDTELSQHWKWEFMLLGYTISVFGAFIGLTTTMIALTVLEHPTFKSWFFFFILSSGVSIGFTCVWTMHFVGMQALTLKTCNGSPLENHFNVLLTMVSLVAAILISSLCIYLALPVGDKLNPSPAKNEVAPLMAGGASGSMGVRRTDSVRAKKRRNKDKKDNGPEYWTLPIRYRGNPIKVVKIDMKRFTAATLTLMLGVCIMHYMGMVAQYGPYTMSFDAPVVLASAAIALAASGAGLFIVVQIAYQEKTDSLGMRLLASFIIGAAVNAMHYTGMLSAHYKYTGDITKALPHVLGPSMNVPPAWICLVSMVSGVVMMLLSQHYSDLLYILQQKINESLERKLPKDIQEKLQAIYDEVKFQDSGAVATYIPALAEADPDKFAIAVCDLSGDIHTVGDVDATFSIQSACKPLLYMLAIEECGGAAVNAKIGQEPSGQPFDALSIDSANRAFNPYVNAGAMVSASLLRSSLPIEESVYDMFEDTCRDMASDEDKIILDQDVYSSEMSCNDNNMNIAKELFKRGILASEVDDAVTSYTQCCSMLTTAEDMAVMAATFANRGKNPLTKEQAIPEHAVDDMVTVMMSCGMYNGAGKWIVDVGLPAKSGVSGVVMCVVPGICGLATYSPRLDENGNSTRGVLVAKAASEDLGLHVLKNTGGGGEPSAGPDDRTSRLSKGTRGASLDQERTSATMRGGRTPRRSNDHKTNKEEPERTSNNWIFSSSGMKQTASDTFDFISPP